MHKCWWIGILLFSFISKICCALTLPLTDDAQIVGTLEILSVEPKDSLPKIARLHGFGLQEIKLVNPALDTWLPKVDAEVILPGRFILPNTLREGIVLNIPEMRLYYYPAGRSEVWTYPVGIGRQGWLTPYVKTRIIRKQKNPTWYPPESIRKEHEQQGDPLPKIVPPGPDNPLGAHAFWLQVAGYLIHGTNKPYGIGIRVSHGCIRLYPEDIATLYPVVALSTPVNIINQPYKLALHDGLIYLEAHSYLEEDANIYQNNISTIIRWLAQHHRGHRYKLDEEKVYHEISNPSGIPIAIGVLY